MTAAQIKYVVSTVLGYSMDTWTDFSKVSMIYLDQDSRLYVSPKTKRFKFNSDGTISICEGVTRKGAFIPNLTATDGTYGISHLIRPEVVGGFIRTSVVLENGRISNV